MAFVAEDGTGLVNANSNMTVAAFDDYHTDRGNTYPVGTGTTEKEQALISATDYIEQNNGSNFLGCREFPENPQALSFPRTGIYYDGYELSTMPAQLLNATAEYALRALTSALSPDPEVDDSGRTVIARREKVGPIEEDLKFNSTENYVITRPYPGADKWLKPLLRTTGGFASRA